jgi:hypothetical protein
MELYVRYLEDAIRGFVEALARGDLDRADDLAAVAFGWAADIERANGKTV